MLIPGLNFTIKFLGEPLALASIVLDPFSDDDPHFQTLALGATESEDRIRRFGEDCLRGASSAAK